MKIKPRHKRRLFWTIIVLIGLGIIGLMCIPPLLNLNKMRPVLQEKLTANTGITAQINGNVNVSLLGSGTIVAHNVIIPNGKIDSVSFSVPFKQIFNLERATLNNDINISNGTITITDLFPTGISHNINIYNTDIYFMNHEYKIVRGTLSNNKFSGQIRTPQHKYDIKYDNGEFVIINSNDNLHIRGTLFPDGGAAGEMSISTPDINKWFEFENPKINEPVSLSMEFNWDGGYGFDFTNIVANNYNGSIKFLPNGFKYINFESDSANLDLSFIATDKTMLNNTGINLDLAGKIKFQDNIFSKFKLIATGVNNKLEINQFINDTIELSGGTYDNNGLHNTKLKLKNLDEKFSCNFSGTKTKWECYNFNYGDIRGNITSDNGIFHITATSTGKMPNLKTIRNITQHIGDSGTIDFTFSDMSGTMVITPKQIIPKFNFAQNTTLRDLNMDFNFLPKFMSSQHGTYTNRNNKKTFIPQTKQWTLEIDENKFVISGENFKQWLPGIDLRFLNNMPYIISGTFGENTIGDLNIMIADHIISGVATKSGLTLDTEILNLDKFINPIFRENYNEQKFLTSHPLATLFEIPQNISLSADVLILNDQEYKNFVYSLKPETQVFSISDANRGNMLGIIEKKKFDYDISIQLNKFKLSGELLTFDTPLNIGDTTITAEAKLHTSGQTANDLVYNLSGNIDAVFTGGYVSGLGFDAFYSSADNITILNAEYMLGAALESGKTRLKKLKISGIYNNGNFETTKPLTISLPHIDGVGALFINNRIMTGTFEFVMRGTAPKPASVEMKIIESGQRKYSIAEIINNLDIGYMRAFTRSNNKF
ncbi:MAG: hypothetical protein IKL95_00965 [Alphaproteobacteria bacterium]|nr:hypothetical protein [Alphaproteobacteria bacterium]